VFTRIASAVCPRCEKADEENFAKVREYIEEDPLCNINELAEATQVPVKRILQYLREGRLEVTKGLAGELRCVKCGTVIEKGNFCDICTNKLNTEIKEAYQPVRTTKKVVKAESVREKQRMHTDKLR
jgi:uncharacterized protein (UPF0212 family)